MSTLRIRNATILTQDDARRVVHGDLYCEGGRITHVGTADARREADRELDGTGQVVVPGLINLHTHVAMGLFRGYGDDMLLEDWLGTRIWPAEAKMDEATMRAGCDLGLLEMLCGGTTSFLDMYFLETEALAPATQAAGLRGWLGEGMVDIDKPDPTAPNPKLAKIERLVKDTAPRAQAVARGERDAVRTRSGSISAGQSGAAGETGPAAAHAVDGLLTGCPSPHGTYTCSDATYRESARIAREYGVPMHTHCSETRTEVHDVQAKRGKRPVDVLADTGALAANAVLAHCGWITKGEVATMAAAHAAVAHCPVSNMKLATGGTCPVPELQSAGVRVGLGTDGSASNNTLDLFGTMKLTSLLQKQQRWDATVMPAQRVLDMATRDGADALQRPDLGRIAPGATADLAMVDFRRPHLVPRHDAVSHLVYAANAGDVSATIVSGRVLMAERRVETMDVAAVLAAAQKAADALTRPL